LTDPRQRNPRDGSVPRQGLCSLSCPVRQRDAVPSLRPLTGRTGKSGSSGGR
jgi:hypothetical protein